MKKRITTVLALALSVAALAQESGGSEVVKPGVGIGQPLPAQSAALDIAATNRGVLIPRVDLGDLAGKVDVYGLAGGEDEGKLGTNKGMLVFNTTAQAAETDLDAFPVGFYQWNGTKWERIVSQVEFETVIEKIQNDIGSNNETVIDGEVKPIGPDGETPIEKEDEKPGEGGGENGPGHTDGKYLNVVYRDGKIYYIKKVGDKLVPYEINLENLIKRSQLVTQLGTVSIEGEGIKSTVNKEAPEKADLEKAGAFYYEFVSEEVDGEGNQVKQYINLGADVASIIKEALDGKDGENGQPGTPGDISKVIQDAIDKYLRGKNNVYYGPLTEDPTDTKKVLYEMVQDAQGNDVKTLIDIAESVKEVFNTIIEKGDETFNTIIKEAAGDIIAVEDTPVFTGDYVGLNKVYKVLSKVTVEGDYDSEFKAGEFIKATAFKNILHASVYDANGNVVVNSVTDISSTEDGVRFAFGTGNMYTPLAGGTYFILLEYVSTEVKEVK